MWVTPSAADDGRRGLHLLSLWAALAVAHPPQVYAQDTASTASTPPDAGTAGGYSARGRIAATPGKTNELTAAEADSLEHHMGASFAYAESLPGVVPVFSGVPYLIVRGASPAGSLSLYDGIPLPALFHVALGPSLIDPDLSGETRFYAGVAPARYGAHVGGVMERTGPDAQQLTVPARTLQLSLLDTAGMLKVPVGSGGLAIAWRYGNPGLMLRALNVNAVLDYHDFQVRYQTDPAARTHWTFVLLGAGDHLGERTAPQDDITLAFQRLLARVQTRVGRVELGSQLILSHDDSTLGQELGGNAMRASEAVYAAWSNDQLRVRAGAELSSALVKLERGTRATGSSPATSFARSRDLALDPEDFLEGQPFSQVPTRTFLGSYAELNYTPWRRLSLQLGLRGDAFVAGSHVDAALGPMARVDLRPTDQLMLHAGIALTNRPRTSPLPIPGLNDVALDSGVESAWQSELGASIGLPEIAQLEATLFYNRYRDAVYMELILDCQGNTNPEAVPAVFADPNRAASICRSDGLPTANGESYGLELFLKRDLTQQLSGFVSYTLGYANAIARDGTAFTPQADVRHLINAVLQYDFGHGFGLGLRLHYRTGKMAVNTTYNRTTFRFERIQQRLPGFLRLDMRLSYAFKVSFGRMEASLSLQNATFSQEATNRDCFDSFDPSSQGYRCEIDYQPFIVLPNVGLRADF